MNHYPNARPIQAAEIADLLRDLAVAIEVTMGHPRLTVDERARAQSACDRVGSFAVEALRPAIYDPPRPAFLDGFKDPNEKGPVGDIP